MNSLCISVGQTFFLFSFFVCSMLDIVLSLLLLDCAVEWLEVNDAFLNDSSSFVLFEFLRLGSSLHSDKSLHQYSCSSIDHRSIDDDSPIVIISRCTSLVKSLRCSSSTISLLRTNLSSTIPATETDDQNDRTGTTQSNRLGDAQHSVRLRALAIRTSDASISQSVWTSIDDAIVKTIRSTSEKILSRIHDGRWHSIG